MGRGEKANAEHEMHLKWRDQKPKPILYIYRLIDQNLMETANKNLQ